MRQKIQTLLDQLNHGLIAREDTLKAVLLTVLAGENIVLIGPPGTGKSMLARRMAEGLGGAEGLSYFEYLLTKFSTPEELFGPLSISALKQDRFHRNTAGYLPSVELAFLDEVFKASSSILNALLTLMNERLFHNGAHTERAPLRSLIAASNELPTGQEELAALYDRFLVRCFVDYVGEDKLHLLLAAPPASQAPVLEQHITQAEIDQLQTAAQSVTLPAPIAQALQDIWHEHRQAFKEDRREQLSDRRLMKCLYLLRISAATNGRNEVDLSDLLLLKDCLWNHPENTNKVRTLVLSVLRRHSYEVPSAQQALLQADDSVCTDLVSYEVAEDGATLVPVRHSVSRMSSRASEAVGKMNAAINGWCGSGTQHDPLLVQTAEDLMHLSHPEIGLQGYHFRQTKNIDCSLITTWPSIDFKGYFNGEKFVIQGPNHGQHAIFSEVYGNSTIDNVRLKRFSLAKKINGSLIKRCSSDIVFLIDLKNSQVSACHSDSYLCSFSNNSRFEYCSSNSTLISGSANGCTFKSCFAGNSFFGGEGNDCVIQDCSARLVSNGRYGFFRKGIKKCSIERCFVFGRNYDHSNNSGGSGFAKSITDGFLKDSVIGIITPESFNYRIAARLYDSAKLINNYSIDKNISKTSDKNSLQGQSIAESMFTQRFFENHVKWDFHNIWKWNQENNQPELRHTGVDAQLSSDPLSSHNPLEKTKTEDLLTMKIRANIWL